MVQLRQRSCFTGEPFGERGIIPNSGRQNLQGNEAVQLLLTRLVNRAHSSATDKFQDFELWKECGQFSRSWRHKRLWTGKNRVAASSLSKEADGAKTGKTVPF